MKFEIKLDKTQRYILRTTTGYSGLSLALSEDDLEANRDRHTELPKTELPYWKIPLLEREKELEQLQAQNLRKLREFYSERKALYDECARNKNRSDAALAFRAALSRSDIEKLEKMSEKHQEIFEERQEITDREGKIYHRQHSKLIGILGLALHIDYLDFLPEDSYYINIIPPENLSAVQAAVVSGVFSKEIAKEDLGILHYIHKETQRANAIQKRTRNPAFSVMNLAFTLERTDIEEVEKSMHQLTGLLCHLYLPQHPAFFSSGEVTSRYLDKWFIPKKRYKLIDEVLK